MSHDEKGEHEECPANIDWRWRLILGLLGGLAIVSSLALFAESPVRSTRESAGTAFEKTTLVQTDPTTMCVALISAGLLLLFVAANGRKLLSVSKDGAQFDAPPRDQIVKDVEEAKGGPDKPETEEPVTEGNSLKTLVIDGLEYRVFRPQDVPSSVIAMVGEESGGMVKSAGDIQYGFRQSGKGNHAWFVKAKTGETWKVAFGGQGKLGPTLTKVNGK